MGPLAVIFFTLFTLVTSTSSYATINPPSIPIQRFIEVTPDIFRGAHPSDQGLKILAEEGLKSDIDLENISNVVSAEQGFTSSDGLLFLGQPMSGHLSPDNQEVDHILALLNDSSNYPVFIHCKYGEDRTGLIVGLYRVFTQNWTASDAYKEMIKNGFHPSLTALKDYFDQKTAGH